MTLRRVALAIVGCIIAGGLFLLTSQAPAPVDAVFGQVLSDVSVSSPADPPANFSVEMRTHMETDALHVEKLEFFYSLGQVQVPTMTKSEDGTVNVHVWVARPRVQLFSSKCEFVRTLQFSIPKSALNTAKRLVLVNHDTGLMQVLAETDRLGRLLREPDRPTPPSMPRVNSAAVASGCGG